MLQQLVDQSPAAASMRMGRSWADRDWHEMNDIRLTALSTTISQVNETAVTYAQDMHVERIFYRQLRYIEMSVWGSDLYTRTRLNYTMDARVEQYLTTHFQFNPNYDIFYQTALFYQEISNRSQLSEQDVYAILYWVVFTCSEIEIAGIRDIIIAKMGGVQANEQYMAIMQQAANDVYTPQVYNKVAAFTQSQTVSNSHIVQIMEQLQQIQQTMAQNGVAFSHIMPSEMTELEQQNPYYESYVRLLAQVGIAILDECKSRNGLANAACYQEMVNLFRQFYSEEMNATFPDDDIIQAFLVDITSIIQALWFDHGMEPWMIDGLQTIYPYQVQLLEERQHYAWSAMSIFNVVCEMAYSTGNINLLREALLLHYAPLLDAILQLHGLSQEERFDLTYRETQVLNYIDCLKDERTAEIQKELEKDILKRINKFPDNFDLADAMACYYLSRDDFSNMEKMLRLMSKSLPKDNEEAISRYHLIAAEYYFNTNQWDLCITHAMEGRRHAPIFNEHRIAFQYTLMAAHAHLEHIEAIDTIGADIAQAIREDLARKLFVVENAAAMMREQEKSMANVFPSDTLPEHVQHAMSQLSYDWLLIQKGLLLAVTRQNEKTLLTHPSSQVRECYQNLLAIENELSASLGEDEQTTAYQWKENVRLQLQSRLRSLLGAYYSEHPIDTDFFFRWQQVRDAMDDHTLAIEFAEITKSDSIPQYIALLLRHDWDTPRILHLFPSDSLVQRCPAANRSAEDAQLMHFIWDAVLAYTQPGETVYFSPAGMLHQLPVEYMMDEEGLALNERYDMRRVTSTREIVLTATNAGHIAEAGATLIGGVRYDEDTEVMEMQSREVQQEARRTRSYDVSGLDSELRAGVKPLPGTKKEVQAIDKILRAAQLEPTLRMEEKANEEFFKSLDAQRHDIIHIATHGFYWSDSVAQQQDLYRGQTSGQTITDPLSRCGLLFAGANMALKGRAAELPAGVEDGILTAKEISLMNLDSTSLVVLSACETAKGDVNGEGVFGLQRAFKMAGAQTLILSLWPVDDAATQMLMEHFYRHWIGEQMDMRSAFRLAQNAVREDMEYPEYWAAFVLIDGQ